MDADMTGGSVGVDPRRQESSVVEMVEKQQLPEGPFHQAVVEYKLWLIMEALKATGGNVTQTARRLGVTRQRLQWLLRRLGMNREEVKRWERGKFLH